DELGQHDRRANQDRHQGDEHRPSPEGSHAANCTGPYRAGPRPESAYRSSRRRFSIFSTAFQCAGSVQVLAKASTVSSASSGLRCARTALTVLLIPATAAGGAAAIPRATSASRLSNDRLGTTTSIN